MNPPQKSDVIEFKPNVEEEDVTETRPSIAQIDITGVDTMEHIVERP